MPTFDYTQSITLPDNTDWQTDSSGRFILTLNNVLSNDCNGEIGITTAPPADVIDDLVVTSVVGKSVSFSAQDVYGSGVVTVGYNKSVPVVNISYKGSSIAQANETKQITLTTSGKYLEDNVSVSVNYDTANRFYTNFLSGHPFTYGNSVNVNNLPSDFQEVEWIRSAENQNASGYSTNLQYIKTGVYTTKGLGFYIDFTPHSQFTATQYGAIFGARRTSGSQEFQLSTYSPNGWAGSFRYGSTNTAAYLVTSETRQRIKYNPYTNIYEHPQNVSSNTTYSKIPATAGVWTQFDFQYQNEIVIFALNSGGTITQSGDTTLCRYILYIDYRPIRDFIPCVRKSDGVAGLYDNCPNPNANYQPLPDVTA